MTAPNGLAQIIQLYGDPHPYIRSDGTVSPIWDARMVQVPFPASLPLGWNKSVLAQSVRVNQAIASEVDRVFTLLDQEALWPRLRTFDGGYAFRPQRGSSTKMSLHSWGGAMDFNAESNPLGTIGDMDPALVQVFEACGWTWGGRWSRPDGMHFQFATGY